MFAYAFDRPNLLSGIHGFRKNSFRVCGSAIGMVAAATLLVLAAMLAAVSSAAFAHDVDCKGRPPSKFTKLVCCGKAEFHALDPSQIHRDADLNYVVDVDGYAIVVPERLAEPSGDECSAIFFNQAVHDPAGTPAVSCFQTPLGF